MDIKLYSKWHANNKNLRIRASVILTISTAYIVKFLEDRNVSWCCYPHRQCTNDLVCCTVDKIRNKLRAYAKLIIYNCSNLFFTPCIYNLTYILGEFQMELIYDTFERFILEIIFKEITQGRKTCQETNEADTTQKIQWMKEFSQWCNHFTG